MTVVVISGVGGTGKTTTAELLSKKLKWKLVKLNDLVEKTDAYIGYDEKRKSKIVSVSKLKKEVKKLAKKHSNLIIEGLYAHEFPADFVIVLRCKPDVLEKRLKKKYKWKTKIVENKEAEMIGLIAEEALDFHPDKKVYEIDTTKNTVAQTVGLIRRILEGKGLKSRKIDWI
jgi:adenylate kinase